MPNNVPTPSESELVKDMESDFDSLACCETIPVLEKLHCNSKAFVMVTNPDTAAGYVKLLFVKNGLPLTYKENSSTFPYEEHPIKVNRNGPANTLKSVSGGNMADNTMAYRCRSWPSLANEWVCRVRRNGWPDQNSIKRLKTLSCFLIGKGHPKSIEQDLEWRLSFSLQERELMFGLNDVQHKCYVLLKLIKKDLITKVIGESITSYHCKTCLFYMIEKNPLDIWRPENLLNCVKQCLQLLLDWTKTNYCPNYFIPTENMFDGRITGSVRDNVIKVLNEVLSEGSDFLKRIKTDNINSYFRNRMNISLLKTLEENSRSKLDSKMFEIHFVPVYVTCTVVMSLLQDILNVRQKLITEDPLDILNVMINCLKEHIFRISNLSVVTEHTQTDTSNVVNILLPFFHTSLASHLASLAMICKNTTKRKQYIGESVLHYKHGMLSDLTSGRLKYLTFLYYDGQYSECEKQLMSLEREYKSYVTTVSICADQEPIRKLPIPTNADISTNDIFRTYVHVSVLFLPTEYPRIPDALLFEMFRSFGTPHNSRFDYRDYWYDWVIVDSRVYLYFLWYLLAVKMNKPTLDRFSLMFKLILSSLDLQTYHKETAFNLISWVCAQEGFILQAFQYLIASWNAVKTRDFYYKQSPQRQFLLHHNAAKWHMLLLLKRVWQIQEHSSHDDKMRDKFCFHCYQHTNDKSKQCDKCRIARYCSQSCKMNNVEIHEKICNIIRRIAVESMHNFK